MCIQAGYQPKNGESRMIPIVQSTTFKYDTSEDMGKLFDLEASGYFYTRLAKGGCSYIVIGDVAPVRTASPTPKLYDESQIEMYKKLADALHEYDCKVALQLFHPEYDVQGVGKMIMEAGIAGQLAAKAKDANDVEEAEKQQKICDELTKGAYAKLHHDMQHFVTEASVDQLTAIKNSIA